MDHQVPQLNKRNKKRLVPLLITGASGFVGSHFLNAVKEDYYIYAIARRNQKAAGVSQHPNIRWMRGDIAEADTIKRIVREIAAEGGVDYVYHFAGYYDFSNKDNEEYYRTNVKGTQLLLENCVSLNIKRFIFSSSLTVSEFSKNKRLLDENSPQDANFPYAKTKREAEHLVKQYSTKFPVTIVRLAAIFSDWCEYGPLYILLGTWLSGSWKAKVLAGSGETAIPYLHIIDLNNLLLKIIKNHAVLNKMEIIIASGNGCSTHNELFQIATKYYFGRVIKPQFLPVWISSIGVILMNLLGSLTGRKPFEQLWMMKYINQQMRVDSSKTQQLTGWTPKARYHITRRLLFLIENMKSSPYEWELKNQVVFLKTVTERPNLRIYEAMVKMKNRVVEEHAKFQTAPENQSSFPTYQEIALEERKIRAGYLYHMLEIAIHNGDRMHILRYTEHIARERHKEGFSVSELTKSLISLVDRIERALRQHPQLINMQQRIHDEIVMTKQLILDEIEDVYERLTKNRLCYECKDKGLSFCIHDSALSED